MARPAPRPSRTARSSSPPSQRRRKHDSQESVRPPLRSRESLRKMAKLQDEATAPARSALALRSAFKWECPKSRPHRRHRHVRFASNEKSYRRSSSQECLESAVWPVALPHSYGSNAVHSAKYENVEDNQSLESEAQEKAKTKSKSEATANTEVKTLKAETTSMEKIEEWSEKVEKEERKHRLKIRTRSKHMRRINDEESSNEKMEAKPRVAVKLYDGRDSWPLEISKWHLSDHGQLLLSCLLPTQTKGPEAKRSHEPSETVIPKKVQNDNHRKGKRKRGDQDIVTLFERSAISRSVFQTQPYFNPRHTNSETLIWSPLPTPTFTPTPVLTPPMTPITPDKFSTLPATPNYLNICLMPTKAEMLPTIQMQPFSTRTAIQKEVFTQTSPLTSALQIASCIPGRANISNTLTTREILPSMAPETVIQSSSSGDCAITSPNIYPITTSNSLHSGSSTQTMMEIETPSMMIPDVTSTSQIMPMMSVTMTPIVKRSPDTTSGRSSTMSATNAISSPLTKKANQMAENVTNIKPYQLTDTKPSFIQRCTKSMHPDMITTMSSAVQCFSSASPSQKKPSVSPALTITPVAPPATAPVSATWAPSSAIPFEEPSFAVASTATQTPILQTTQIPLTAPTEFPGTVTAGAPNAAGVSVTAYDMNRDLVENNTYDHPPLQALKHVSETQHPTLAQKNTQNNMSRLDIAQQILKRLTVDIQAQHARICDNTHESHPLYENLQQPIDAVSHLPEGLEETNAQLGSVSLIIHKNQGSSNPLTASSNIQQSPEVSLDNNQPTSTITWKFWHPQSASWFTLSLPEKNAHQMLQSAEPVKKNFENLLQTALNVRNPSIDTDPKRTEKDFPNSMSLSPEITSEHQQKINVELRNQPAVPELRFEEPQDGATTFLNKDNVTILSSEEIPGTNIQCSESTNDLQIQSSFEGEPSRQSPIEESQSCSALPVEFTSNDHRDANIKMEEGRSPDDNAVLNKQSTSSVVWRLWEPNSCSWVSLNISKGNLEQVNECQEAHIQDANLETETGKSTEGSKENSAPNSNINEDTTIPKRENISSTTQTPEASLIVFKPFSEIETQKAQLGNEKDSERNELNSRNFIVNSMALDLSSGQQSPALTNDMWSDNPTSVLESIADAETWGVWPTSSLESLSVKKTRSIKSSSRNLRRQKSSNASTPNSSGARGLCRTQSNTRADTSDKPKLLRYPQISPRTFLRSELSIKRWLQRRQIPSVNGRSNHRFKYERWRHQRSLVNSEYHRQCQHVRRSSADPQAIVTIRPADQVNLNNVETPSLLLLCLTADSSLLPRARYQRSNKKQYCIIQNTTAKKFGNPDQVPWKRASRQWRRNLATDK